jgi:hypothetical protein
MLANLYTYFFKSPQKHLECLKLAELMETKGLKILRNIKTRWISMLVPTVRVMNEYRTLLVKIQQVSSMRKPKKIAVKCFINLVDVWTIIGFACIMPMLRLTQSLMKQGCLNGRPTVKFTVQTSFSSKRQRTLSGRPRAFPFPPRMRFYTRMVLTVRVGKNPSTRTLDCVCTDAPQHLRRHGVSVRTHSPPPLPPPVPSPPLRTQSAIRTDGLRPHGRRHGRSKN